MQRILWICKFSIVAAMLAVPAAAQESRQNDKPKTPEMQALRPGPEMDRLKFLLGTWDLKAAYEKTPLLPQGGAETGWYKARLGTGGFSVLADFELDGPLGKEIGHEVIDWDPKQNAYSFITAGNFPGVVVGTARWEGGSLVMRSEVRQEGNIVHLRITYSNIQEKSVHMEEFFQAGDAPERLLWKGDATKKPDADQAARSKIPAAPIPPPTHMVTRP